MISRRDKDWLSPLSNMRLKLPAPLPNAPG